MSAITTTPPTAPTRYVIEDEHGLLRVADTPISLDSVYWSFRHGDTAETIRSNYPDLSLEQVYGAIAFILANMNEVEGYIAKQEEAWERGRTRAERHNEKVLARRCQSSSRVA